jgi:hypothetical protein
MKKFKIFFGLFFLILVIAAMIACSKAANEKAPEMLNGDRSNEAIAITDSVVPNPTLAKEFNVSTKTPSDKKFIKTVEIKFRTNNVLYTTEKIEDLASAYGGYIIYSNLQNRDENYKRTKISRDSILISRQITVLNNIQLKIPNEILDSLLRKLNPLVSFFDYRIIKLDDVTLQYISTENKTARFRNYEKRQTQHIDSGKAKLRDISNAEDNLLDRQNEADNLFLNKMGLDNDVNYCTVSIEIYQKSIIATEVIPNFEYVSGQKPNIIKRIGDSVIQGWWILEELIVFLVKIWGIVLLIIGFIIGLKYFSRFYKKL